MNCGQVFRSIAAWRKISGVSMKPKIAFAILKYTKKVSEEYDIIEKQRIALIHEVTGTEAGAEATIEPESEEFKKYITGLQEILLVYSDLKPIDLDFEEVVGALDEKNETLTVSDLATLEPFFDCDCDEDDKCRDAIVAAEAAERTSDCCPSDEYCPPICDDDCEDDGCDGDCLAVAARPDDC